MNITESIQRVWQVWQLFNSCEAGLRKRNLLRISFDLCSNLIRVPEAATVLVAATVFQEMLADFREAMTASVTRNCKVANPVVATIALEPVWHLASSGVNCGTVCNKVSMEDTTLMKLRD